MRVLKIFSGRSYIHDGRSHIAMLYPFWDKNSEDPRDPSIGRFDKYTEIGSSFFKMTALEDADIAVFPGAWEHVTGNTTAIKKAEQFIECASEAGKPTVIFFFSDSDEDIPYKNTVIFRTSLYRSRRKSNEFAMPAWSEDFVTKYLDGQLLVRKKKEKPVIGFCGYAPPLSLSLSERVKHILYLGKHLLKDGRNYTRKDSFIRAVALKKILKCPQINTNFVTRRHFLGGAVFNSGEVDFARMQILRQEYLQNMLESDYVLCARGGGNYSYRLYEALSCGRIPVFIDTDCVLPYHSEVNWKEYCIWVDEKEVDLIGKKIIEFHDSLSPEDYVVMQKRCRKLYEEWLSPVGFFANFYRHFKIL